MTFFSVSTHQDHVWIVRLFYVCFCHWFSQINFQHNFSTTFMCWFVYKCMILCAYPIEGVFNFYHFLYERTLYYQLLLNLISCWWWRRCFLNIRHTYFSIVTYLKWNGNEREREGGEKKKNMEILIKVQIDFNQQKNCLHNQNL